MSPDYTSYQAPPKSSLKLKLILLTFILLVVTVFSWFIYKQYFYKKVVVLMPAQGSTITIGNAGSETLFEPDGIISKTTVQQKLRLNPGVYTIEFSDEGKESQITSINLQSKTEVKSPTLSLVKENLDKILSQEEPSIKKVLLPILPQEGDYKIKAGQVYMQGDWYAAKVVPADKNQYDTYSVVAHKEGSTWKTASKVAIVLYKEDYKNIPISILRDINNR